MRTTLLFDFSAQLGCGSAQFLGGHPLFYLLLVQAKEAPRFCCAVLLLRRVVEALCCLGRSAAEVPWF